MVLVGGAQGVRRFVSETTPLRDSKSNVPSNLEVSLTVRDEETLRASSDWVKMAGRRLRDSRALASSGHVGQILAT